MKKYLKIDPRIKGKTAELIDPPVVIRVKKFHEDDLERFSEQMSLAHQINQPIIPIVVDSYGGSVDTLIGMITEIQNAKIPVATIIESKAMSAGAILFSCGTKGHRYVAPLARIMLHNISSQTGGQPADLQTDADESDRINVLLFNIMAKNCGKKPDYFLQKIHEGGNCDWYLTPKDAKKINLCDKIHSPSFTVSIKVDFSFE